MARARAPPAGETDTNAFLVTGSTGDVTSTTPSTPTTPEKTVGLSGAAIGRDLLNGRHYIEITFRPSDGFSLDNATIDGGEIQLRDASGNLIALAAPVRVGLTNTYRYAFVTDLAVGKHTITFVAGSFGDTGGTLNLAETEEFTVATPIAALADPIRAQVIDAKDFNGRGYVDITFASFHENAVDAATILDSGAEITHHRRRHARSPCSARPLLVGGSTYRYFFTGHASGALVVSFIDGSWANTGGIRGARSRRRSDRPTAVPTPPRSRPASRPTSPRPRRSRAPGSTSPSPRSRARRSTLTSILGSTRPPGPPTASSP